MTKTNLVVGAGIALCVVSVFWLQTRFDASDHGKAERLAQNFRVPGQPETFAQFLLRQSGAKSGTWSSEITGGCRGVVRVTWLPMLTPAVVYAWDVDIPGQTIHPTPASPDGEKMLRAFTSPPPELPPLELYPSRDAE